MQVKYIALAALIVVVGAVALFHKDDKSAAVNAAGSQQAVRETNSGLSSPAQIGLTSMQDNKLSKNAKADSKTPVIQPGKLREEQLLIDGKSLDTQIVMGLARSETGYNQLLESLGADSSVEAAEKTQKYQNLFLSNPLYASGAVQVTELKCGLKLCAAIVASQDKAKIAEFINAMSAAQESAMYVSMKVDSVTTDGMKISRWIFSTAPELNSAGA